jgi:hypothetical protein
MVAPARGYDLRLMAISSQFKDLVDALGELTAQHIRLARAELAEDARFVGVRVGRIIAFLPFTLVGYGFLCVALALVLRRVMPADLAFALVGSLNVIVGLVGMVVSAKQLEGKRVLDETLIELEASSTILKREDSP